MRLSSRCLGNPPPQDTSLNLGRQTAGGILTDALLMLESESALFWEVFAACAQWKRRCHADGAHWGHMLSSLVQSMALNLWKGSIQGTVGGRLAEEERMKDLGLAEAVSSLPFAALTRSMAQIQILRQMGV